MANNQDKGSALFDSIKDTLSRADGSGKYDAENVVVIAVAGSTHGNVAGEYTYATGSALITLGLVRQARQQLDKVEKYLLAEVDKDAEEADTEYNSKPDKEPATVQLEGFDAPVTIPEGISKYLSGMDKEAIEEMMRNPDGRDKLRSMLVDKLHSLTGLMKDPNSLRQLLDKYDNPRDAFKALVAGNLDLDGSADKTEQATPGPNAKHVEGTAEGEGFLRDFLGKAWDWA